jgi:hypothetical protein
VDAYQLAKGDSTKNPELTGPDFAQLKRLAKAPQFTRVLYRARLANMVHHQFHASMEYSLSYFCTKFREFDDHAERIKQAKSGQRPGNRGRYLPAKAEDFGG